MGRLRRAIVTGSSGLVGSEMAAYLDRRGWAVDGVDNNLRRAVLGEQADTSANLDRLRRESRRFTHHDLDVRDAAAVAALFAERRPDLVVHAAAQPSHALAGGEPVVNFEVNTAGTVSVLEAARLYAPESPFVFLSSNKVYGDAPNRLPLVERETRWDFAEEAGYEGVDESLSQDGVLRTPFGASKAAADLLVQEYGRYFGLPTVCFRASCITGSRQAGAELHGFLAYLGSAAREGRTYRILGYGGKQVRDNLHASDVCTAVEAFADAPVAGAVFNLGGGRARSVSILEAVARFEELLGRPMSIEYVDEPRKGDHVCYITHTRSFRSAYPAWSPAVKLEEIFREHAGVPS
jgi:CDP-paratose 2-epimerase